ncbi:MAG: hypothetical protein ABIQ88_03610 [Chitinophagaceae bacterium]
MQKGRNSVNEQVKKSVVSITIWFSNFVVVYANLLIIDPNIKNKIVFAAY